MKELQSRKVSQSNIVFSIGLTSIFILTGLLYVTPWIKKTNFERHIKQIQKNETLKNATLSITAKYEGEKENFMEFNTEKKIHPGSNFKLFTAAAALKKLGPDFTYSTKLYKKGNDLILVGSGDPTFKQKDFAPFVEALKKTRPKSNKANQPYGKIYYNDSTFKGEKLGPGWAHDWKNQYFSVPITGLQINNNLLEIYASKNTKTNKFETKTAPLEEYQPLLDEMKYLTDPNKLSEPITATMDENGTITLHGDTMLELPFRTSSVIKDPSRMTAEVLKQELMKAGLAKNKTMIEKKDETEFLKSAILIYEHHSKNLKEIIFEMLKFSKNNYAETLIRTLPKKNEKDENQKNGVEILKDFLEEIGITEYEINAFDGSGLSPSTRMTGNTILKLFEYVNKQEWKEVFWNSLPQSQIDGTLKHRFENAKLKYPVIAKTGTHEFSSSLSGKILRPKKIILFSVHIYNHPFSTEESVVKIIPIIDQIIVLLERQF